MVGTCPETFTLAPIFILYAEHCLSTSVGIACSATYKMVLYLTSERSFYLLRLFTLACSNIIQYKQRFTVVGSIFPKSEA